MEAEPTESGRRNGARNEARSGRGSPPTARVVRVLDELARTAPEPVGLAQIARQVGLASSTCLGILNELVDADYVVRHTPGPRYSLGTTLVTVGQAAQRSHPGLALARKHVTRMAGKLSTVATVATVVRDEIVVLVRVGETTGIQPYVEAGAHFPFFAPIGVMFVAWDIDESVDAWLRRAPMTFDAGRLERLRRVIRSCREEGWLVERLTETERTLHQFLPAAVADARDAQVRPIIAQAAAIFTERDYLVGELPETEPCSVSVICAPTFDADGRPDLVLSAYVMRDDVPGAEIRRLAEDLRRRCDTVTAAVGGRDPWRPTQPA